MNDTRKCFSCGKEKPEKEFPGTTKRTCTACKTRKHNKSVSGSHEAYLRDLCAKAKYAVNSGRRAEHVEWRLKPQDLIDLWDKQEGRCAVSGVILTHHKDGSGHKDFNASIDRISNDRSYSPDNIQLVCYRVNIMRHSLSGDMFFWWIRTINDFSCS